MSRINETETKKLEHMCLDARVIDARICQPIPCASDNPKAGIAPQTRVDFLRKGDVCVAITFYPSGHLSPDCSCDTSKIYDCPYRRTS